MERYLEEAATAFSIAVESLAPIRGGNSGVPVYRARRADGSPVVLKFHRPYGPGELGGVIEGLEFVETLAASSDEEVSFATPIRTAQGEIGHPVELSGASAIAAMYDLAPGVEITHRERGPGVDLSNPIAGNTI